MANVLMNIVIGIVIVIGFFVYWGRANGWFKEGGFVYEWMKQQKEERAKKKTTNKKKDEE